MIVNDFRAFLARVVRLSLISVIGLCMALSTASAQDDTDDESESSDTSTVRNRRIEEIVVTGSRLKRDTYSSIAPLQIITGQVSREIGSIDPSTILQESTAAAGIQTDITFQGFVLDNGPGASTIDLRGFGGSRTLVLINGRRIAPAGVEGAPVSPDLNMVPSSLVQQYEILLDGASSIYGSDAIAGVANIILRKDFDGLELEAYTTVPQYANGIQNTFSAAWGKNGDRGFFGVAVEYNEGEPVRLKDRPWTDGCESPREIDENGNIRTINRFYEINFGMSSSPCITFFGAQRIFDTFGLFGSIYWTEGESNTGIPNFSEASLWSVTIDGDGDGNPDVDFTDYWISSDLGDAHMFPERDRISAMAYGEYTFEGEMNLTPFFEMQYNKRKTYAYSPGAVIQEVVPGNNPFNPCNPSGVTGVDCGLAYDSVLNNPTYLNNFAQYYEGACAFFGFPIEACTPGLFGLYAGPVGQQPIQAQVSIRGDRDDVFSEVDQLRIVAGIKGDLPMLNAGSLDDWSFDLAFVHSDGRGTSLRRGINEERLDYSLSTSVVDPSSGQVVCGTDTSGDGIPDSGDCVPVNLFAPSLYQGIIGNELASQAERDFLFSDRSFVTDYVQSTLSLVATGDLFNLTAGTVAAAIGYEFRNDDIDSIPNDVARDGLLWGFFRDLGAVGSKDTKEWFAEIEIPLMANEPGAKELTLNLSTRHTDDEFYGGAWTYSSKLAYRPIDSLLLRATVGTSYRAPNLAENFLGGQSGFRGLFDPCVTPENTLVLGPDGIMYDPSLDTRDPQIIANCIADGVDPTDLGIIASGATTPLYSVEVLRGVSNFELDEEKSKSFTAGFAWEQPFFQSFDLTIGATYYNIDLRDEIIQLFSQLSINDCYTDVEGDSTFCSNITRDPITGLIVEVAEAFLNRDSITTEGVDINLAFDWPTQMFGRAVDIGADVSMNRKLKFQTVFVNSSSGETDVDDFIGEFGLPKWEGQAIVRADVGKFRLTWNTRFIDAVAQNPLGVDSFSNVVDGGSDTCLGPAYGDVNCRDIGYADHYYRHDASFYYLGDVWTIGVGVRNLQNTAPPQVDGTEVFSFNNVPFGAGYDVNGRTYFFNVRAAFQ